MRHLIITTEQGTRTGHKTIFSIKGIISIVVSISCSCVMPEGWAVMATKPEQNIQAEPAEMEYNSAFLHGSGVDVSRFSEGNPIEPGTYPVNVSINGQRRGKYNVAFKSVNGKSNAHACFTIADMQRLGIKLSGNDKEIKEDAEKASSQKCMMLEEMIKDSKVNYDGGDYNLDIVIPQINIVKHPRGYVDPNTWDSGVPVIFLDYNANVYTTRSSTGDRNDKHQKEYNSNLGLVTGANIGGWRIRQRSNTTWDKKSGTHTDSLYTYAQTDITILKSQLTVGDSNTRGDVFDSFSLRGIQLQSDDRMLPEGVRNYTPILRGIAETNAKVRVTQRGRVIYETVVTPGPFELNDIGAMGYGGDLEMTVIEADGRRRTQSIAFSAPPMLLHPGVSQFNVTVGELREDFLRSRPKIIQGIYQYGINNLYTLYGGTQISNHYNAFALGNAFNTPVGGVSIDVTHAKSDLYKNKKASGNSFSVSYNKFLEYTSTDLMLAAYRYSTEGYYTFREASVERYGNNDDSYSANYRAKQRFSLNLGQRLWNDAYITFSGSLYNYWDGRSSAKQFSVNYNKSEKYFSYSLSATRTRSDNRKENNTFMLSINIPFGRGSNKRPLFDSLYTTVSHDNDKNTAFQVNASGSQGEQNELSYGVGSSVGKYNSQARQESVSANIDYRSPMGQFGLTTSADNRTQRQLSGSANGSIVAHKGGVTLGPQLGDYPFAIVDVPGGKGAKLLNGYGAQIDRFGYAIVPSLTPYRENSVSIDARGLPDTVDVLESESTVVPRMGSAIAINMKTVIGVPSILIVRNQKNAYLPIGTELFDEKGISQGIIGQSGMAFVRGWDPIQNPLHVNYAKGKCRLVQNKLQHNTSNSTNNNITQVEVTCIL
ncbi:fimbria/pilus outer membrane usher protein [Rouxiella sp. Mn2063]|uniref:fimbria/pilus outer membrane usher protein n=1 Tax=Rouxiella sp. Mn2063 TaxID=3395262 RepID=UPI003BE15B06